MKKIVAGKAFFMQSKHVKVIACYLPESGALQEHSQICPAVCLMPPHSTESKKGARWRRCSGPSMLRPDTRCP